MEFKTIIANTFAMQLLLRFVFLMSTFFLASWVFTVEGYYITRGLCITVIFMQFAELYWFVFSTNRGVSRVLNAARHGDYTHGVRFPYADAAFPSLSKSLSDIHKKFDADRLSCQQALSYHKAIIEHVPVPLIVVQPSAEVTLLNSGSRKMFARYGIVTLADMNNFGVGLAERLQHLLPGKTEIIDFNFDDSAIKIAVSLTVLRLEDGLHQLLSFHPIQGELDSAQLQAWQDLVRVLTHEIINSITPVASLARTAVVMAEDIRSRLRDRRSDGHEVDKDLDDIVEAVSIVAARSESLTTFISHYRRIARLPTPEKNHVAIKALMDKVVAVTCQSWHTQNITLQVNVNPEALTAHVDAAMLEQLLINLLTNAEQAMVGEGCRNETPCPPMKVHLGAFINPQGHLQINVDDSGPGIAADMLDNIFVPFFTTKPQGSGVGLALARQIAVKHGGTIHYGASPLGGARFMAVFVD